MVVGSNAINNRLDRAIEQLDNQHVCPTANQHGAFNAGVPQPAAQRNGNQNKNRHFALKCLLTPGKPHALRRKTRGRNDVPPMINKKLPHRCQGMMVIVRCTTWDGALVSKGRR